MDRYKKLMTNTIAMVIGNFASKILVFVMLPLYTSVLSTEEYGISDLIFSTTNLLFPIFTCLATEYVLRFTLELDEDKKRVFSSSLIITLIGFVLIIIISPIIDIWISFNQYWIYFFLYYLSSVLVNICLQFVKGLEQIWIYSFGGIINTGIVVICNIIFLLKFKSGIVGYIMAYVIGAVVTIVYLFISAKLHRYLRPIGKEDYSAILEYLKFSLPMIPNSLSWWMNNSLDKYMLMGWCSIAVTGIYAAGYKIPSFLTIISSIFLSAWQISAVQDFGSEDTRLFFSNIYRKYSAIVIIMSGIIVLLSKLIASILLSNEFFQAWKFAPILVYAYIFQTMSGFLGTVYTSSKKTKMLFLSTFIGAMVNMVMNIILIPKLGATGAAIATTISYIVVWLIRMIHSKKTIIVLEIKFLRDVMCYLIILGIVALIIMDIIISYVIAVVLCLALVLINKNELMEIWNSIVIKIKNK